MQCLCPFILSVCAVSGSLGNKYIFINESRKWTEAQSYCRGRSRDLATISSVSNLRELQSAQAQREISTEAWIGLSNIHNTPTRSWHWSGLEQENIQVENWRWVQGEPSDLNGKENCVSIECSLSLLVESCCSTRPFICYDEKSNSSLVIHEHMTWSRALHFCRQNHSDLLSGWSQLEDSVLREKINRSADSSWWVGLFRDPWSWSDTNHSTSFRNWLHPDRFMCEDASLTFGRCGTVGPEGTWGNGSCTEEKPFICYRSLPLLDSHLILVRENLSWQEALDYCRHNHSDLLSITSQGQQTQAEQIARQAQSEAVWLGAHYTCLLELWMWNSGEFVVHQEWSGSSVQSSECGQAAAIETAAPHQWLKKSKSERYHFICVL